jgi:hypothetical protein
MADGLLDGYQWVPNDRNGGGTYAHGPARIVLHTMEGWLNAGTAAAHRYPPHLWASPRTGLKLQTVPLHRSAFALYQGDGPYTNKAGALQVEIEGFAAEAGSWGDDYLVWLAQHVVVPLCRWAADAGSPINLDHVPPIGTIGGSASEHAPQRLSYDAWNHLDGLCSHRHVPDNDHWDTGTLNIPRLVELSKELLGGYSPGGTVDPPPAKPRTRRAPVVIPATQRPGAGLIYDVAMIAEGDKVPNQAGGGPTVVASTLVVRQLEAPNGQPAHVTIVWGSGRTSAAREIDGVGGVARFPCPYTGLASVVSDRPLAVHGEIYTA